MIQNILAISSHSFIIVICSILFMFAGHKIDVVLNTSPSFMLGLLILAIFITVGRLYKTAMKKVNEHK